MSFTGTFPGRGVKGGLVAWDSGRFFLSFPSLNCLSWELCSHLGSQPSVEGLCPPWTLEHQGCKEDTGASGRNVSVKGGSIRPALTLWVTAGSPGQGHSILSPVPVFVSPHRWCLLCCEHRARTHPKIQCWIPDEVPSYFSLCSKAQNQQHAELIHQQQREWSRFKEIWAWLMFLSLCVCAVQTNGLVSKSQLTSNQRLNQTKMSLLSGTLNNVRFTDKKWSIKEGQNNSIKKPKFPSCWLWLIQGGLSPQRLLSPAVKHWPNTSQRKCKCFGCPVPQHP